MEVPSDSGTGCVWYMCSEGEGGGPQKLIDKGKKMMVKEDSENFTIGFRVNPNSARNPVITTGKSCFTEAQRRELEHQALIFKHIVNGLPIPVYLVQPIWNSLANNLVPDYGSVDKQLSTLTRDMLDSEPRRCRRTDGKRWRCRKTAVLDEKYCEKHMHRGRERSRKPVEASKITFPLAKKCYETFGSDTGSAVSNPLDLSFMTTSSDDPRSSLPTVTNTTSNNDRSKNNVDCAPFDNTTAATGAPDDDTTATAATSTSSAMEVTCTSSSATVETSMSCPITLVTSTPSPVTLVTSTPSPATLVPSTSTPATLVGATFTLTTIDSSIISTTSDDEINIKIEKQDNSGKSDINNSIFGRSCENRHAMNSGIKISTGTGFSPSSVLQVLGCKDSRFKNNINDTELQPGRCRRTDGKKWRCRRDVLPDQKYCARHMHRGAKRSVLGSLPVTDPVSSVPMNSGARLPPPATEPKTNTANTAIQKRNLTSPISTSHQQIDGEEKSLRSSDSETTISDTKSN